MACVLYKDGGTIHVEIEHMGSYLKEGYSTSDEKADFPVVQPDIDDDPGVTIADMRTPKMVRDEARAAGIDGWEKQRIKTLKGLLYEQKD